MDELTKRVEQLLDKLEKEVGKRQMSDLEYGRYTALMDVLDLIEEIEEWGKHKELIAQKRIYTDFVVGGKEVVRWNLQTAK